MKRETARPGILALSDGTLFRGEAIGASGTRVGEVVFTTSHSGYQEVLSDPSYADQIVTMTVSEIGNVGVNREDLESDRIQASGMLVRSSLPTPSNWRAEEGLHDYLEREGVVALSGIDTRALVLHIRETGAQMGTISTDLSDVNGLLGKARDAGSMVGRDLARTVTTKAGYRFFEPPSALQGLSDLGEATRPVKVLVYDFGVKKSILRRLVERGAEVHVVPATTSAADALAARPHGVLFSNGPGDPEPCTYAIEAARGLMGKTPLMGICLGHQILGLAYGARTFKLKFGHRGSNQPVRHEPSGKVLITSQNHGFAIDPASFPANSGVELTEYNLNDGTLAGFEAKRDRVLAVQYHPEASPGPHDASDAFGRFIELCRSVI